MPHRGAAIPEIGRRGGIAPGDAFPALQIKLEELDAYAAGRSSPERVRQRVEALQ